MIEGACLCRRACRSRITVHACSPRSGRRQLLCRMLSAVAASWPWLADLLSRAGLGSASVAVIRGESGCGKTHLLNALAEKTTTSSSSVDVPGLKALR